MKFQTILTHVCITQTDRLWMDERSVNTTNLGRKPTAINGRQIKTNRSAFCSTHGLKSRTKSVLSADTTREMIERVDG